RRRQQRRPDARRARDGALGAGGGGRPASGLVAPRYGLGPDQRGAVGRAALPGPPPDRPGLSTAVRVTGPRRDGGHGGGREARLRSDPRPLRAAPRGRRLLLSADPGCPAAL